MISVTFYNFSKQVNSTARPSTNGVTVSCLLKESTSTFNPTFVLDVNENDVWNYTYTFWGTYFYYVVDKRRITNDIYEIDCEIDVLATWKTQILATSAFVRYCTNTYDIGIPDLRLSSDINSIINKTESSLFPDASSGYVVTYIGEQASTNPCVLVSGSGLISLMNAIQDSAFAEILCEKPEFSNALSKLLSDCGQAITGCFYTPRAYTEGSRTIVLAGGYDTGVTGKGCDEHTGQTLNLNIPWNFPSGDFRNRSYFSTLLVYLPGYGYTRLNIDDFQGQSSITINAVLDSNCGVITYDVGGKLKAECSIATPIQVSTTTTGNGIGTVASVVSAVGNALSGNVVGAVGGAFNAVLSDMTTNTGAVGSMGSTASWYSKTVVEVIVISHNTNVEPSTMASRQGRPLNRVISMPSSGYVETTNFSVNCNAPNNLKEQINTFMNGGVYIE